MAAKTTISRRRPLPRRPPPRARLTLVHPRSTRARVAFDFAAEGVIIGRDEKAQLCIDDGTVSRQHLAITWHPDLGAHGVRDLDSRNGSAVDGEPLGSAPRALADGAVLRAGSVLLVYERLGEGDADVVSRDALPGRATRMAALRAGLARAAVDRAPLLLVGESGTGKEWIAREAHRLSGRGGPFIAFNCATLNATLADAQLFGHVRGAFTGATDAQPGLFRGADGGTLFLDEVGELPLELQPKLLRAIQLGEIQPVGSVKATRVDVRLVAATHRNLERAVAEGRFRLDLYGRLSLWELPVPSLRERRVDLFDWIARFDAAWRAHRGERETPPFTFAEDAAEALLLSPWPLNLRGLDRLLRHLSSHPRAEPVSRAQLPSFVLAPAQPQAHATPEAHDDGTPPVPSREAFTAAFVELDGKVTALARRFKRDRRQIYRWIETYKLRPDGT